jgi:pilus assembly protein CpaF
MEEELEYLRIREELRGRILKKIDFSKEVGDDGILDLIDTEITEASREHGLALGEMEKMRQELFYSIRKLDVLQELLDDPSITEIMINGSESIYIERDGAIFPYPAHFASGEKLYDVIQKVVADCDRTVNTGRPIADARLPNGSRVNIVLPPAAINGPIVTIRRFPERPIRMDDLLRLGSVPEEAAGFLRCVVAAGYNIFISGGTGSGKTTFLNALSEYIPSGERVITIEDNAELQIQGIPNLVRLEARTANVEGGNEITIRDLIRTSLRMRPDRIIVGEVRGAETIDMLQAMNTGHDGSMSTGHANSPADMLLRLETLILMGMDLPAGAIRGQLASGLDLIVHLGRLRDRSRKLLEIDEIRGIGEDRIKLETLFRFRETGEDENGKIKGVWDKTGELRDRGKLRAAGIRLPEEES